MNGHTVEVLRLNVQDRQGVAVTCTPEALNRGCTGKRAEQPLRCNGCGRNVGRYGCLDRGSGPADTIRANGARS